MIPKVDTFEHDIANEIRRKEASLAEIEAISKQSSPNQEGVPPKKIPWVSVTLAILLVASLFGISGVAYYYFTDALLPPSSEEMKIVKNDIPKIAADLVKLSPTLGTEIGRYVSSVEKKDVGYIITINNYSAVFGYMTRNENAYIEELTASFPSVVATATTQTITPPPQVATSTLTASTTSSSTKQTKKTTGKVATTTMSTSSPIINTSIQEVKSQPYFSDLTLANQNMRVYKKGNTTVIYAFVGNKKVIISNTPEGILALRNAILR